MSAPLDDASDPAGDTQAGGTRAGDTQAGRDQLGRIGLWTGSLEGVPPAGIPDLLMCTSGLLIGLEVKHQKAGESLEAARKRATPTQRQQFREINAAGGMAGVVTSVEEALELVQRGLSHRTISSDSEATPAIPPEDTAY